MKQLSDLKNLKAQVVLLRADLNVENPKDSYRIERATQTPKWLRKQGAITIIVAHRGKPHGYWQPSLSLKSVGLALKKHFKKSFFFVSGWNLKKLRQKLERAKPGDIFLLENLRFHRGEERNDRVFAHQLSSLADIYVNDAFSVSHREHASIVAVTKYLPSYAGLLFSQELKALSSPVKKPLLVILGGGKASDKFAVVKKLYPKTKHFLIGGVLANTFLVAEGENVAASVIDRALVPQLKKYLKKKKILLPSDYRRSDSGKILDIGPRTQKEFSDLIKKARTVIWSGPMGYFEDPRYRKGSEAITRAIAHSKAYSVVGGGETSSLILSMNHKNKVSFLSTAGSAMLAYLAGDKMPGLKALK